MIMETNLSEPKGGVGKGIGPKAPQLNKKKIAFNGAGKDLGSSVHFQVSTKGQ